MLAEAKNASEKDGAERAGKIVSIGSTGSIGATGSRASAKALTAETRTAAPLGAVPVSEGDQGGLDAVPVLTAALARVVQSGTYRVPLEWVRESAENERQDYDLSHLIDLGAHMRETGGINTTAAIVRPMRDDCGKALFELITGHCRSRALKLIGMPFIKCEIHDIHDAGEIAKRRFGDNLHNKRLNALEQAQGWRHLMALKKYASVEAMAADMGRGREARSIRDLLSLDKLSPAAAELLRKGEIEKSHAVLLARETAEDQAEIIKDYLRREEWEGGGLVSEKELRDGIGNFKQEKKWAAERKIREEKEKAAALKAAAAGANAKAVGKKTPEQIARARERAAVIEKNRKERQAIRDSLAELLAPFDEAGGPNELPTGVLREVAQSVHYSGFVSEVIDGAFGVPASNYKRDGALRKMDRMQLIRYIVAAVAMPFREYQKKKFDGILAEVKGKA